MLHMAWFATVWIATGDGGVRHSEVLVRHLKKQVVPVDAVRSYGRLEEQLLCTKWRWVSASHPGRLTLRELPPVPTEQKTVDP
jgi:hypothetical protein